MTIHPLISRLCLLCACSLLFFFSLAGQSADRKPYFSKKSEAQRADLAKEVEASVLQKFQPPARFDKESKEDYLTRRTNLLGNLTDQIGEISLHDDQIFPFLQSVHRKILETNPIAKGTRIIPVSNPVPNAYSVGDGTIVVFVGLLANLENEDQVAFVLCHEIAHYLLAHSTNRLESEVDYVHSKAFKEKVKKLNSIEFNRNEQIEALILNTKFKNSYHSRDNERGADSLAYELYIKTNYEPLQPQRLMQVFEIIDEPFADTTLDLPTRFGCPKFPFNTNWRSNSDNTSVWAAAHAARQAATAGLRDSLSSHPESQQRYAWLVARTGKTLTPPPAINPAYVDIRYAAVIETVEAWLQANRFDETLYAAKQYQNIFPQSQYLNEVAALALANLYVSAMAHRLSEVLAQSNPWNTQDYNNFLDFLNNLRAKEMLGLANCTLDGMPEKNEYALLAAYQLADANPDTKAKAAYKKKYFSQYPNGRFAAFFK